MKLDDTIVALATPAGLGAIAVIRISGPRAIDVISNCFQSGRKKITELPSHTVHLGLIRDRDKVLDQVLVTLFIGPNSYTGQDVVEISCHGSTFVQQQIVQLLLRNGCRMAEGGEFTLRAFLNGKIDLSQAEAVADLISSENEVAHQVAINQMRGGFSQEIKKLRDELLNFASLIELELDFAEEDVEFADRSKFSSLLEEINTVLKNLIDSFALGNVLKNGMPVAIVGEPNVGKSTLLNALLNEERAIVSEIPGTTRDTVEDEITIEGIGFRFIDTAGIRDTTDLIENIGIQKTYEKVAQAQLVLYVIDISNQGFSAAHHLASLEDIRKKHPEKRVLVVLNKTDLAAPSQLVELKSHFKRAIELSAKSGEGLASLKSELVSSVNHDKLAGSNTIITNSRHYSSLLQAQQEIFKVQQGLSEGLTGDLLAIDIRQALYHLGEITGEITTDELLGNIFSNFCIGK